MNAPAAPTGPFGEPQQWPAHDAEQSGQAEQPASMRLAVRLMWVGAALSLLGLVLAFVQRDELREQIQDQADEPLTESELDTAMAVGLTVAAVVGAVTIGLWLWMAYANGQGKAWARTTATVLGVLNVLFTTISVAAGQATSVGVALSVVGIVLAATILFLLYRPDSNRFYDAMSSS